MASHPISTTARPSRRTFNRAAAAGLLALPLVGGRAAARDTPPLVGALFAGRIDDHGFMEAGWRGLERARLELGARTRHIDGVAPSPPLLAAALDELASSGAALVIAHGGQNNEACAQVAARHPGSAFVVTQGSVTGANLCSYDVLQEESAYLAGVLAALSTKSGVVGHMSGIRVRPGLKGRAAYAAGVRATDPGVRILTNFSGNQDDNALSRRVALAQMDAGVDVIFTMLNAGRDGVTEACRARGTRQIGNVIDWTLADPDVFIGSAVADVGIGVFEAVRDFDRGRFPAGTVRKIGIANAQAVRLTTAPDVLPPVRARIAQVAAEIETGKISVPEHYDGPEFATPA